MVPLAQIVIALREQDPNAPFEKFRKHGAKEFYGNEDPDTVDDYLVQVENIFKVFTYTGCQKVALAAYMFQGISDA